MPGAVYGSAEWLSLVVHTVIHCFFFFFCEIMPLRMDGVWLCFLFSLYEILGFNEHAYLPRINLFDEITKLEATLINRC